MDDSASMSAGLLSFEVSLSKAEGGRRGKEGREGGREGGRERREEGIKGRMAREKTGVRTTGTSDVIALPS